MSRSTALGPRRYTPQPDRRTRVSSETYADSSLAPESRHVAERHSRRDLNTRPIDVQSLRGPSPRPRARPPSPRAQRVFKWVRGERIGEGSYGQVFLAMNATTGEVMAVKQVEKPTTEADRLKGNTQQLIKALLDESETLRHLDHPNIVQYLGFEENLETLNIFLEYIPGGTIHSCLRRYGIFKDNVARSFTTQILQGLQYLHSRNIMHRDLKSENILVQPTGICKISDFGISKYSSGEGTRVHTAMKGTFHWMAPEVVDTSSRSGYTNKIDIWSLGCVALEMWSAERPWAGDNWVAVLFKVIQEKSFPPVPKGIYLSEIMEDFRRSCFHADPQLRPSAAELLGHPYLVLPTDWEFPGVEFMGKVPSSMVRRGHSPSEATARQDRFPVQEDDTAIAGGTLKPLDLKLPASRRPSLALVTDIPGPNSIPPVSDQPANLSNPTDGTGGPPVVYITPPGSPRGRVPDDDWLLGQATSSEPPGKAKPNRRLVVHNPDDPTLISGRNTPVYNPPPLPPATSSSRLDAAPKHSVSIDSLGNHQRRPSASGSISHIQTQCQPLRGPSFDDPSRSRMNGGTYSTATTGTGVSFDSTGSSIWQVPPAGLLPRTQQSPAPKGFIAKAKHMIRRSSAASTSSSPAIADSSSYVPPTSVIPAPERAPSPSPLPGSMATPARRPPPVPRLMTRPVVEEVYENLTDFFPGHNLDEPIIESPIEPPTRGAPWDQREDNLLKRVTMKSIRNIAEEQHLQLEQLEAQNRRMGRQTGLWDARVEEINGPGQAGEAVPGPLRANRRWS